MTARPFWIAALVLTVVEEGCMFGGKKSVINTTTGMEIELARGEVPEFKRIYKATLEGRASIRLTLTAKSIYYAYGRGTRYVDGELTQPNGSWVLFDPKKVAEKILDPILVPLVEQRCAEMFALDKEFLDSHPAVFG